MVFTICLSLSFLLAGCSSDCDDLVAENETYGLRSILTDAEINSVNEQLMKRLTPKVCSLPSAKRAVGVNVVDTTKLSGIPLDSVKFVRHVLPEDEAKKICTPYLNDGKSLQSQMLRDMQRDGASAEDIAYVRNMSESQLATLSFAISNIQRQSKTSGTSVSRDKVLNCLKVAIGIPVGLDSYISGTISLSKLASQCVNWKFALKLCRNMALRYVGFIGAAVAIYDFIDCM